MGLVREVSDGRELWEEVRVERGGVDCRRERRERGTQGCGGDGEREGVGQKSRKSTWQDEGQPGQELARRRSRGEKGRRNKITGGRRESGWTHSLVVLAFRRTGTLLLKLEI
mgnify:CR=1 FL=1